MGKRKGANSRSAIPAEILRGLNEGTLESATLSEGLAIDFGALLRCVAPELPDAALEAVKSSDGVTRRMRAAGDLLAAHFGSVGLTRFAEHQSDTVRGWAAYAVAALPRLTLDDRFRRIRSFANDPHFGVREWAWLAVREAIATDIRKAIQLLTPWTSDPSSNIRRFVAESTRPRGVWCTHIQTLKATPELALPLLEPLRSDPAKYVRDSVANWLNDAAKTQPKWVRELCGRWQQESPTTETNYIVGRAVRSL